MTTAPELTATVSLETLASLMLRIQLLEKALGEISQAGLEPGENCETAVMDDNGDNIYGEGYASGAFHAGGIARKALLGLPGESQPTKPAWWSTKPLVL